MINVLKIGDIKEWLNEHKPEFEPFEDPTKLPAFDEVFQMYYDLREFVGFYKYRKICALALAELPTDSYPKLQQWAMKYENLGAELMMFDLNYLDWTEVHPPDVIKVTDGIYSDMKPFRAVRLFCYVFHHLYWDYAIHDEDLADFEIEVVMHKLRTIMAQNKAC